jgi:hypothetical protein
MATFVMQRIPVPNWAPSYLVRGPDGEVIPNLSEPGGPETYALLMPRYPEILSPVDKAVNEYVNNDGLTYGEDDDENGFPSRKRLSGDYYLARPTYAGGNGWYTVSLMARCLEKPWLPNQIHCDYLGLDVSIALDTAFSSSLYVLGVDSSVI